MHIGYWWESQNVRDHWEDQDVKWLDNVKTDLREVGWYDIDCLRIGASGGLF
jgi:hypothetical protein